MLQEREGIDGTGGAEADGQGRERKAGAPAHRRLSVLELAERLGNVAEACRRGGIDRTSFYDGKRRFQLEGLDGLKDMPPIAKSHPTTTPPEVVERIAALALLHPAYGCNRLEAGAMVNFGG